MQVYTCPFCGLRDEREFFFAGEAGAARPDTTGPVSDAEWAEYVRMRRNALGRAREVWMHLTCGELFVMERDTLSARVLGSVALRRAPGGREGADGAGSVDGPDGEGAP